MLGIETPTRDIERARALDVLRQSRPCRVCGLVFTPTRWDAVVCSTTCQQRRHRGRDLDYLAELTDALRKEHRRHHENTAMLMETLQQHSRELRARRRQRRVAMDTGYVVQRLVTSNIITNKITKKAIIDAINEAIPNCPPDVMATIITLLLVPKED